MLEKLEAKILESFKNKLGKEVENLDLIVSIPDCFDEEKQCEVLEAKDNGRVWTLTCTTTGNVREAYEL